MPQAGEMGRENLAAELAAVQTEKGVEAAVVRVAEDSLEAPRIIASGIALRSVQTPKTYLIM